MPPTGNQPREPVTRIRPASATRGTVTTTRIASSDPSLGSPTPVPLNGCRDRIRSKPGLSQVYRGSVFAAGLGFIAPGFALSVLPGPLTIPPILVGFWIWSTEFRWARRWIQSFQRKARHALEHAKKHPVSSSAITIGGLVATAAAFCAVQHFDLIARGRDALG